MMPVISFIGRSNTGKTTLLEKLIPELQLRGYRVAVAKHVNEAIELDTPGKDSWRLARAGADAVVLSTPSHLTVTQLTEAQTSVEQMQHALGAGYDIFLVEGYKAARVPKIEVRRSTAAGPLAAQDNLVAVVSESPVPEDLPRFSPEDIGPLADFIERTYLAGCPPGIALFVNGENISLDPDTSNLVAGALTGMVSALKGVREVSTLQVWLNSVQKRQVR